MSYLYSDTENSFVGPALPSHLDVGSGIELGRKACTVSTYWAILQAQGGVL